MLNICGLGTKCRIRRGEAWPNFITWVFLGSAWLACNGMQRYTVRSHTEADQSFCCPVDGLRVDTMQRYTVRVPS